MVFASVWRECGAFIFKGCEESKIMCRVYWYTHTRTRSSFTGVLGATVFMAGGESKKMCLVYWYTHKRIRSSFTGILGATVFMAGGESKKMCLVYWYTHVAAVWGFLVPASSRYFRKKPENFLYFLSTESSASSVSLARLYQYSRWLDWNLN